MIHQTPRDGWLSLGTLLALTIGFIATAVGILLVLVPESGPSQILIEALRFGWPGVLGITALALFIWFRHTSNQDRLAWTSTCLALGLGYVLLCMAMANFKHNFNADSRLLLLTLFLGGAAPYILALGLSKGRTLLRISGFMVLTLAAFSAFGNWPPQVEGGFPPPEVKLNVFSMPPQQIADEGEKIIFGGIGMSKVPGAIGKGQCPLCHGFWPEQSFDRSPNLWGITARKRLAPTSLEYIAESHVCPSCYVVGGFEVRGSEGRESPMPKIHKPPISLTLEELVAIDTWLFLREGEVPPTPEEIISAYKKYAPEQDFPKASAEENEKDRKGRRPFLLLATGQETVEEIFKRAQCGVCHTIPGILEATGTVGPKLGMKARSLKFLKDGTYKGKATTAREYILESILDPSRYVVKPFPDNVMPKIYGDKLNGKALEKMVDYLVEVEEGKNPPKIP